MQHICTFCNKCLTRKSSLKQHISTVHNKHRRFHCNLCPKHLSTAQNLRRHVRIIHEKKLFRIINNDNSRCKRFKYCDNQVTFRINPTPKGITPLAWYKKVFDGILNHFKSSYKPGDDDLVGLTIRNSELPDKDAFITLRKQKDMNVETVINTISKVAQSNTSFSLIGDLNVCYKHIKSI